MGRLLCLLGYHRFPGWGDVGNPLPFARCTRCRRVL